MRFRGADLAEEIWPGIKQLEVQQRNFIAEKPGHCHALVDALGANEHRLPLPVALHNPDEQFLQVEQNAAQDTARGQECL